MRYQFLLILLVSFLPLKAQHKVVNYFKYKDLEDTTSQKRARFSEIYFVNDSGRADYSVHDLKHDTTLYETSYVGDITEGRFKYHVAFRYTGTESYNFDLKFATGGCAGGFYNSKVNNYFQDVDAIGYKAPRLLNGTSNIMQYILYHVHYPEDARLNKIEGKVFISFAISKEGSVENIGIVRGGNYILDNEAYRLIKNIHFKSPALYDGKPVKLCITLPITFKIGDTSYTK